jgi:hypothetical protein
LTIGYTLASRWPRLSEAQKESIVVKLKGYFNDLCRVPSPGYFGSLGKRYLMDEIFWTPEGVVSIHGPFETEDALNEAMAQKYEKDGRPRYKADHYRQFLPHILSGKI